MNMKKFTKWKEVHIKITNMFEPSQCTSMVEKFIRATVVSHMIHAVTLSNEMLQRCVHVLSLLEVLSPIFAP